MRKALAFLSMVFVTVFLSIIALFVSIFDRTGRVVHNLARLWAKIHLKACGIEVKIDRTEPFNKTPMIIMCNHQSALDIYALLTAIPVHFKWIAKRQLFSIPFLGWAMKRAGYISLDRENPREALNAIIEAAAEIKDGTNILIFPEGTRSKDGTLLPFKKGAFLLALKAGVPVLPIGIYGTSPIQPKGSFIPRKKGTVYIHVGEPITVDAFNPHERSRLMEQVRASIEGLLALKDNKKVEV
ncbi:MAG: 1-acyl-sn-glycerol-3-phosphate acyltransferase [Syntrophorhabdaceae bacterium]|nr:1-acyl-sn-glycerol-3-phosphate acyltransferase [Syntrophorhabdaceae bacterium]